MNSLCKRFFYDEREHITEKISAKRSAGLTIRHLTNGGNLMEN
jgi:hypothetical protein